MLTVAMIDQIKHGFCLSRTCQGGQVLGAATRETIARLWQLEQHAPSFYPLERQRDLGGFTRKNGAKS